MKAKEIVEELIRNANPDAEVTLLINGYEVKANQIKISGCNTSVTQVVKISN